MVEGSKYILKTCRVFWSYISSFLVKIDQIWAQYVKYSYLTLAELANIARQILLFVFTSFVTDIEVTVYLG